VNQLLLGDLGELQFHWGFPCRKIGGQGFEACCSSAGRNFTDQPSPLESLKGQRVTRI